MKYFWNAIDRKCEEKRHDNKKKLCSWKIESETAIHAVQTYTHRHTDIHIYRIHKNVDYNCYFVYLLVSFSSLRSAWRTFFWNGIFYLMKMGYAVQNGRKKELNWTKRAKQTLSKNKAISFMSSCCLGQKRQFYQI